MQCKTKNIQNWFTYRRKKSAQIDKQQCSLPKQITIRQESNIEKLSVAPMSIQRNCIENLTSCPIINAINPSLLPTMPFSFQENPQIATSYQLLALKSFLDNLKITHEFRVLHEELIKRQQALYNLNIFWGVLKLLSNDSINVSN